MTSVDGVEHWQWGSDEVRLHFAHGPETPPRLLAVTPADREPDDRAPDDPAALWRSALPVVELALAGDGRHGTAGKRHVDGAAAQRLRLVSKDSEVVDGVHRLVLELAEPDDGVRVRAHYEIASGIPVVRTWAEVVAGGRPVVVEYVSSFVLAGLGHGRRWESELVLWRAANPWSGEFRWSARTLAAEGLYDVGMVAYDQLGSKNRITATSTGAWSTSEMLPMGILSDERSGAMLAWQVEHCGAWHWELGDRLGAVYLVVSGPTAAEHQCSVPLGAGESFRTVPASVAVVPGGGLDAVGAVLTAHRRRIRRPHPDNVELPVVYNDFLNALMSNPTTDRVLPLVEAAAALGVDGYCIDAGWYDDEDGGWWDAVGEWLPSARRFPGGGLKAVIDRIRSAGLRPGLWLEPEVVGLRSPLAESLPEAAFFRRSGERVLEWGRYQLDLRHPAALKHLDGVVDRLMADFDLGYLKLDYNIDIGAGTELAGSVGLGLLEHNRAHLDWVRDVLDRYPGLTIEGCAAGGSRTDAATGALFPIQSLTDQQDFRNMPPIAAAAPLAITPEQAGVWASVDGTMSHEELAFSLISGMSARIHLAGRIDTLDEGGREVVRAALDVYRELRPSIAAGEPVWPLGLPGWRDDWIALGTRTPSDELLLAVWRRGGGAATRIPLPQWLGPDPQVEVLYPTWAGEAVAVGDGVLELTLPEETSARLLRLRPKR
ncbi:glycoside hydrolase family 36 protein [Saccharothrix deserti]|uniref:glycoside hydrolase family 36 protein n=1 Tax=Saccharothrix deserti TaxID=2593674 RepID=UPI00192E2F9B|nr:glycoside hydrolase family 36 protein [Saccharothrix deserti]